MNEYVYKIDLPSIDKAVISLDKIKNFTSKDFTGSKIFYPDPRDIFRPEWLSYKGLSWDYCSVFIRSGKEKSILHKDNPHSPESLHWGINWVLGDASVMEYYDENNISNEKIIIDSGGKTTVLLSSDKPPNKIYNLENGAYLVNASVPHRAVNLSDKTRIVLSLRSMSFRKENPSAEWREIVEIFSDEILQ